MSSSYFFLVGKNKVHLDATISRNGVIFLVLPIRLGQFCQRSQESQPLNNNSFATGVDTFSLNILS